MVKINKVFIIKNKYDQVQIFLNTGHTFQMYQYDDSYS